MARATGSLALLPLALLTLLALLGNACARVAPRVASTPLLRSNFVGEGTNELATLILQGYVDSDKNLAFSPLGYSALLAILAEGARGETRRQLEVALHLPEDTAAGRAAYLAVLERLREKNVVNKPELRNWFYVYKNHTVEPSYKEVLHEYYLTDVKSVSRPSTDIGFQKLGQDGEGDEEEKTRLAVEKKKNEEASKKQEAAQEETVGMEDPTKETDKEMQNPMSEEMKDETKKDDKMEESKPMGVEKPKDEMKEDQPKEEAVPEPEPEKKPTKEEELEPAQQEQGEMMLTSERRKQRELDEKTVAAAAAGAAEKPGTEAEAGVAAGAGAPSDGLSGLSGNALVEKTPEGAAARMLLFNGMYFRGSWRSPFAPLEERQTFYLAAERKVAVPMMRAHGAFRVGHIPELDSVAVELPYEGDRYSLLALLPKAAGGLRALVADLAGYSLRNLYDSMESREVDVTLPCFAIETITRPIPIFAKFGVSDVFDKDKADLSGVSSTKGLYVQDLVQLVTVRVDNSSSEISHITSSALESRTGSFDKIVADKPFLYFVRDTVDNLIVVAGKVVNPEEQPVSYT